MATGFLHGIGYTGDVMNCFSGEIDDNFEEVMNHFIESNDCQVDPYNVGLNTLWGLKQCFVDVANIVGDIGNGLMECTDFDFTAEDQELFDRLTQKLSDPLGIINKLVRDLMNFSSGALTKYMIECEAMAKAAMELDFDALGEHMGRLVSEITGVVHH